ncbi:MAG: protein kinase [Desulfobacterales bacterium]|nr:protein kinase [Desulfobacterales bacterium]
MNQGPITDTTDFFALDCGAEIRIGERTYRITGYEKEQRFGMEDPKYWVKRAVDTATGEHKIIKLAFFESFQTSLAGVKIKCFRDPDKEGAILEQMRGNPAFMQGEAFHDEKGNNIRVLERVRGVNFYTRLEALQMAHEKYFFECFPAILKKLGQAFEAIENLHALGFRHGDIRNDHIIVEAGTDNYVWIDFDYDYHAPENPFSLDLCGMGNILLYGAGMGFYDIYMIASDTGRYKDALDRLDTGDFSIIDKSRLMNLKKIFPYIPDELNNILLHFSRKSEIFYENTGELLEDLYRAVASLNKEE